MLNLKCKKCGNELKRPGGLIFSPPFTDINSVNGISDECYKFHLCGECYQIIANWLHEGTSDQISITLNSYQVNNLLGLLKEVEQIRNLLPALATALPTGDWMGEIPQKLRQEAHANKMILLDEIEDEKK